MIAFLLLSACTSEDSDSDSIREVTAGWDFLCALLVGGKVSCWGEGVDEFGAWPPDERFVDLDGDAVYVCGITEEGKIHCWGEGPVVESVPAGQFVAVSTSAFGACAIEEGGAVVCWPEGYVELPPLPQLDWIAAASTGVCGLTDGSVSCYCREPGCSIATPPVGDYAAIFAGYDHACVLDHDGRASCWGGWLYTSSPPEGVRFSTLAGGEEYTCGLLWDGGANCWAYFGDSYYDLPAGDDVGQAAAEIMREGPPPGSYVGIAAAYKTAAVWTTESIQQFGDPVSGSLSDARDP
jgi:hypothetical protein